MKKNLLKEHFGEIIETADEKIFLALVSAFYPSKGIMYPIDVCEKDLKKGFEQFKRFVEDLPEQLRIVTFI
jgi:hypothetical protein